MSTIGRVMTGSNLSGDVLNCNNWRDGSATMQVGNIVAMTSRWLDGN